ncbi:MAG: Maf family protein [Gammaproteobacteria bacterium]|nr:Maf family protein [Gammaproteobacteria bacterium]
MNDSPLPEPVIHLASQSPRRQALLAQIGVPFHHLPVEVDERLGPDEGPRDYVARLALAKARAGWVLPERHGDLPVLGSDTTVVLEGAILGKPSDGAAAHRMLAALGGRSHQVMCAVALVQGSREAVRVNVSEVRFRTLAAVEIAAYVATGEPMDKAGAYGIQGLAGAFVKELRGSYSGVMGLPLEDTTMLLRAFGIPWLGLP